MTHPLELHSEQYAPTGNIASRGVKNQLGRPRLSRIAVLVREAVQNCWDARSGADPVDVAFDLREVGPEERIVWADRVFSQEPGMLDIRSRLSDGQRPWRLLVLSDRGTTGLGGPTRADRLPLEGEHTDFVDFLRNLGSAPDKEFGGGTFGFGKAALYAVSASSTILVYTRCWHRGALQSRLLAAGLGEGYRDVDSHGTHVRFTGRHWWGRLEGGIAEPVLDKAADELASVLGLPGFEPAETGTTIAIVDFEPGNGLDEDDTRGEADDGPTLHEIGRRIAAALLWNFWPKMVPDEGADAPMRFSVRVGGEPIHVPGPMDHPSTRAMASALRLARSARDGRPEAVHDSVFLITRHRAPVGWLAVGHLGMSELSDAHRGRAPLGAPSGVISNHVALMRNAELVVRYEEGPPLDSDLIGYAGVFVAAHSKEVDEAFAQSEPPTHDDWIIDNVGDKKAKSIVRVALRRVREELGRFAKPKKVDVQTVGPQVSLGEFASKLGSVFMGLPGPGAEIPRSATTQRRRGGPKLIEAPDAEQGALDYEAMEGTGAAEEQVDGAAEQGAKREPILAGRPTVRALGAELSLVDDEPSLIVRFTVKSGSRSRATTVRADADVLVVDGEKERSAPEGARRPTVAKWWGPSGQEVPGEGDEITITSELDGEWQVAVSLVRDAEIQVAMRGRPVEWDAG